MKTALIIGMTGNFGSEMARALKKAGWRVKALMRNPRDLQGIHSDDIICGDAQIKDDVASAAEGCDLIVYAANPPYHRWVELAEKMLVPAVQVAEEKKIQLLFPGNVYNYSPSTTKISEDTPMQPRTDKGEIRVRMEARLRQASERGARVTIIRAGDFFGPNTDNTWFQHMFKGKGKVYKMTCPHDETHVHYWSYLPDLCAEAALLVEHQEQPFQLWHDPGYSATRRDWQQAFQANNLSLKSSEFPWSLFKVLSLFSPMLREVLKMRYLWREPVILNGDKLNKTLGNKFSQTDLADALRETLHLS